jgi:hypothetical protein
MQPTRISIVAILVLVAAAVAIVLIASLFIIALANRYGDWRDDRDREEMARKAEREPTDERS